MLTVLHGDNLIASYNTLQKLKKEFGGEVITLDAKNLTGQELEEKAGQKALFESQKLVILEGSPKANLVPTINQLAASQEIIIWLDKKLTTTTLKGKVLEFKDTTQTNFKLADAFTRRDLKGALQELGTLFKEKTPAELIVGLLTRQMKLILQIKSGDLAGINPYVIQKIKIHQGKWSKEDLLKGFEELLLVDQRIKTGRMDSQSALFNFLTKVL